MKKWLILICIPFLSRAQNQIGDAGYKIDTTLFDARFPDMKEWAMAGVEGGIPLRNTLKILREITPKDNLQLTIDEVASQGGGVILLKNGNYTIDNPIFLKSKVVLRGESKAKTVLCVVLKKMFFKYAVDQKQLVAFEVNDSEWVGFEDLTFRYTAVDFEPFDKPNFYDAWDRKVFHAPETRDTTLFVHLLIFRRCKNSWVDHCQFLWAGTHPLGVGNSEHMTLRNNFIDRSYIKRDSFHGGYYGCWGSKYCLFYNETVKRIRHFAIMNKGAAFNVVYRCNFEVDVNFHDQDDGHNLVEKCRIATPVWHSWDAIGIGAINKHRPPGAGNLLFNNTVISKGVEGYNRKIGKALPNTIYEVTTAFHTPNVIVSSSKPPLGGTLYMVQQN